MKRYFLQKNHRFFKWYCRNGLNVPCVLLDALDQVEYFVRSPFDDDIEEYTVMSINHFGETADSWYNVIVVLKAIDKEGRASYNWHSFHFRFNNICLNGERPKVDALAFNYNHEYWGDTSLNDGSSPGDICTAWDMMKAVNKYFNHINW